MADPYRGTRTTNQAAYDEIQRILASLPDEGARQVVLNALLVNRCRACLDYDPSCGPPGPCHHARRGGRGA